MAKMGFKAVQQSVEQKSGYSPDRAAAVAAAIGRKKFGRKGMARLAAEGRRRAAAARNGA